MFVAPPSPPALPPSPPVTAQPSPSPALPAQKTEIRAALLVPLSGSYAAWGQALSNAAQLALFEVGDSHFNLIPLDTKGSAEGAAAAMRQAVSQGADIILGPLFSPEVKAVAPLARDNGVPVLAFTTDRSVVGNGVYALGFLPSSQVNRVVGYARTQGRERFALLARSDDYGRAVAEALRNAVASQGGQVVKIEYYDPRTNDLTPVIKRFAEVDARSRMARTSQGGVVPPSFDAVLLPEEGQQLRSIASLLTVSDVDPSQVRFLGTLLWDDARLATEPSLQGGWYPAAASATHQGFENRYTKAFGAMPPRVGAIASIAYDATALAAVLARQGGTPSTASLTNPNGFAGVDGLFRLLPDGTSERGLSVREIAATGSREISPAPSTFNPPGQ